jgi:hypothetical protein
MEEESIYDICKYKNNNQRPIIGDIVSFGSKEKEVIFISRNELYFNNEEYPCYVAEVMFIRNPTIEIKKKIDNF